ncbi:hypothetical protein BDN67DRAFT_1014920 [Paxillus ammoniavirescens]|nr:hypothetical protein BDN67DRAFT_1014920 [Paxillus ammoniavirescens]
MPATERSPLPSLPPALRGQTTQEKYATSRSDVGTNAECMDLPNDATTHYGQRVLNVLFLFAIGVPTTQRLREITAVKNEAQWQDFKSTLLFRLGNVNVVGSLILASTAAFLTTQPGTSMADWSRPLPYLTLIAAVCLAGNGVGCGTFLLLILTDAQAESFRQLSHHPRELTLALTLIAFPTILIGAAGVAIAIALENIVLFGSCINQQIVIVVIKMIVRSSSSTTSKIEGVWVLTRTTCMPSYITPYAGRGSV